MTEPEQSTTEESRLRTVSWRRIANIVGLVVLIAVVLPFVVYAVPQIVGANHSYVVLSGSMEPVMGPGDVVIIDSVDPDRIGEGDIITFRKRGAGHPTTHRVIEVTDQDGELAFETKGDANEDPDRALIAPGEIQGKVMSIGGFPFVIPLIGHVIQFAGTQVGFVLLFAVPLVLFIANEMWNIIRANQSTAEPGQSTPNEDIASNRASQTDGDTGELDTAEGYITFSASELQLGLVILGGFLLYSAWVAHQTFETWAFAVAGAVLAAFVLIAGLYLTGRSASDRDEVTATQAGDDHRERDGTTPQRNPVASAGSKGDTSPSGKLAFAPEESTASTELVEFARGSGPADNGADASVVNAGGETANCETDD